MHCIPQLRYHTFSITQNLLYITNFLKDIVEAKLSVE